MMNSYIVSSSDCRIQQGSPAQSPEDYSTHSTENVKLSLDGVEKDISFEMYVTKKRQNMTIAF